MTVLLDATVMEMRPTGIAKAALYLYKHCIDIQPSLNVCGIHRRPLNILPYPGFHTKKVGSFVPNAIWRARIIPMIARREKADAVHFPWSGHVPRLPSGLAVAVTLHDVLPLIIPNFFKTDAEQSNYRDRIARDISRTHLLMTDSEFSKKEIVSHFQPAREPIVVTLASTLGVPGSRPSATQRADKSATKTTDKEFRANMDGGRSTEYFLYVGGYDPRKGLEPMIATIVELFREKKIASRLILTGEQRYYSDELRALISAGIAAGAVEEKGYVSDEELAKLLTRAKALVYPSKYEGFGLPPLEAMALGCPVITTKYTSLPEVCGDAVVYVEPENRQEFAEAIVALEESEELRTELSRKGRVQASRFSWESSAKKYLTALESTVREVKRQQ